MAKVNVETLIGDEAYRNDAVNKIREYAILLGEQPLDSPTGEQLNTACNSVEDSESRHTMMFIPMLLALTKNNSIKDTARQRIKATIATLRSICPQCNQRVVPRRVTNPDVSHATDTDCPQCGQPDGPRPFHCVDG